MNEDDLRTTLTRVAHRAQPEPAALDRLKTTHRRREVRRRATTAGGGLAAVVALSVLGMQLVPNGSDDGGFAGPGGSPSGTPGTVVASARHVAYIDEGQMWVRDVQTGERYRIDDGDETTQERFASFDASTGFDIRWVSIGQNRSTVYEGTLGDDSRTVLLEADGKIDAIAYGTDIAYLLNRTEQQTLYVARYVQSESPVTGGSAGHVIDEVWEFPTFLGRGVTSDDAITLEWSPDGTSLVVVNTVVDTARENADQTMLVFTKNDGDASLERLAPARAPATSGTHAVWVDDQTIAYKPYFERDGDRWRMFDIVTGEETDLAIELPGASNPALSPDGRLLAIENSGSNSIVVLDLKAGTTETVPGGFPLWLDDTHLLVSELEECTGDCLDVTHFPTGKVLSFDMETLENERYPIPSTQGASVGMEIVTKDGGAGA